MRRFWPFTLFSRPAPPWVYASHEYLGVVDGAHAYVVTFTRGLTARAQTYHFHAKTIDHAKDEAKLARYFAAEAAKLDAGAA